MKNVYEYLALLLLTACILFPVEVSGQTYDTPKEIKPVKNVILMISDGTSLPTISLARWYQRYQHPELTHLHLDPYLCGSILTYCSNAPIGDSAPTTSCYMTGMPSIAGFVATYPYTAGEADIVPVDSTRAYRPMMTLMEATRIYQKKRTGIVVTSHLTDATPSDCLAHSYQRGKSDWIMPQIVHSAADVIMGGRTTLMKPEFKAYLEQSGYGVFLDDKKGMEAHKGHKIVSIFGEGSVPYDIDRDPQKTPSLAEMTANAIARLDNENGFLLMVEGSKVDWAAHANDPVGAATDFLAFDRAIGVALDFAKKDGNTVVVVTSDHGNSGLSIGRYDLAKYATVPASKLFGPLVRIKKTSVGLAELLQQVPFSDAPRLIKEQTGIELDKEELEALKNVKNYAASPMAEKDKKITSKWGEIYTNTLEGYLASLFRRHTYIGFTTHGHTGEEVFLAVYAPAQTPRMVGHNTNIELHHYLKKLLGLPQDMQDLSDIHFAPHDKVFAGCKLTLSGSTPETKVLTVKKGRHTLTIPAFTNQIKWDKKTYTTPCATVYVDKTNTFYLDSSLGKLLEK